MSQKRSWIASQLSQLSQSSQKRPRLLSYRPVRSFLKRRAVKSRGKLTVSRPLKNLGQQLWPRMYQTRCVYDQGHTLTIGGASTFTDSIYYGNSIFNPWSTGSDYTVNGHATLALVFIRYKVIASRITVKFSGTTVATSAKVIIYPARSGATDASAAELNARPSAVSDVITTETPECTLVSYARTNSLYGTRTSDDIGFASAIAGNPSVPWYWHIGVVGTSDDVIKYNVTIEYYTVLYEPQPYTPTAK